jgi:hypothetical protein
LAVASSATAITGAGGGSTIVCTVKYNNPHGSTHVGGMVNFVTTATCTSNVSMIEVWSRLEDHTHGRVNAAGSGSPVYGKSYNSSNSALSCVPGTYQGYGSVSVDFPPGYTPAAGDTEGASISTYLTCSAANLVPTEPLATEGVAAPTSGELILTATKD